MSELSPAARRLLNSALEHDGPSPQHLEKLEQRVALATAAAAATWTSQVAAKGTALSATQLTAASSAASSATGVTGATATGVTGIAATGVAGVTAGSTKGLAVALTAKALGGATPWIVAVSVSSAVAVPVIWQGTSGQSSLAETARATAQSASASSPTGSDVPRSGAGSPQAADLANAFPSAAATQASAASAAGTSPQLPAPTSSRVAAATQENSVGTELALIGSARSALRAGNGAKALTLLDAHARRFAGGQLSAERDAVRILALCSLGRTHDARVLANRYFHQNPHSPLTQRLQSSCVAERNSEATMTEHTAPGNE